MSYEKTLIDAARDAHDALAVITRTSHIRDLFRDERSEGVHPGPASI